MFDVKENKTSLIGFRATKEERTKLEELAATQGLTLSNFMRKLVNNYINNSNSKIKE